jgi:putative aldouronate transport system permease protein
MAIRMTSGEKTFAVFNTLLMAVLMIAMVYPLLYVLFASVSKASELVSHQGALIRPLGINFAAYTAVFRNPSISTGYRNTLIYTSAGTLINLVLTTLGAYMVSRTGSMWRRPILIMIVFTMFFSGGLIPSFLLVQRLGLFNTMFALLLPEAISAWNLIIMKTFLESIPSSLEESGRIDGAHDFTILTRIILPVCTPVIAVMILFYSVMHWNSWFSAMIYLRKRDLFPLQLILREILIANDTTAMGGVSNIGDQEQIGLTIRYATVIVATVPVLLIYPFLQKYFAKGVMIGSIKG